MVPEKGKTEFCTVCRKNTVYMLRKRNIKKTINDKEYTFRITSAVCRECGGEISIPGLIDKNIQEVDAQYRAYEGIVSIDDIEKLMEVFKIGKEPLSLALGFEKLTVTRYLSGQIPSKEDSDILRKALSSTAFVREKLHENKDELTPAAFSIAMAAATVETMNGN